MSSLVIAGDTSGTVTLQAPAVAGTTIVTLPSTSGTMLAGNAPNFQNFKNRIINGGMVIDQRNSGASGTMGPTTASYSVDRFYAYNSGTSVGTYQQVTSTAPAGFNYSLKITCTTAASPTTTQNAAVGQSIEGYNSADLNWGTANAKTVTISFWVRASITGTYSVAVRNDGNDRSWIAPYTISVADTWEYKTITVTGDTSGTWNTTNSNGIRLFFAVSVGPDRQTASTNTWISGLYNGVTSTTNVLGTVGATFYISGVQLEVGSVATTFDFRSYPQELAMCQRYYYRWTNDTGGNLYPFPMSAYATTAVYGKVMDLPVTMRANPTCSTSGTFSGVNSTGTVTTAFTTTFIQGQRNSLSTTAWTGSSGMTIGNCVCVQVSNNAWVDASAEL